MRALVISLTSGEIEEYQDGDRVTTGDPFGYENNSNVNNSLVTKGGNALPPASVINEDIFIPAGTYYITWCYLWSYNSASADFEGEILIDSDALINGSATDGNQGIHKQEPKDVGGTGNAGTNQRYPERGFAIRTFATDDTRNFSFNIIGTGAGVLSASHQARIMLWRVS